MLQYAAVDQQTLGLLEDLMRLDFLSEFNLVGGTALALQIGHRKSIDIDLFTTNDFNIEETKNALSERFKLCDIIEHRNSLTFNIHLQKGYEQFVKVDLIKYGYPLLKPLIKEDGIRLIAIEDIIPMKLSALANRSSKKDFYDIFFLLKTYTLQEMLDLFEKKFNNENYFYVIKSLTYFEDAENEPDPVLLKNCSWEEVKRSIQMHIEREF